MAGARTDKIGGDFDATAKNKKRPYLALEPSARHRLARNEIQI